MITMIVVEATLVLLLMALLLRLATRWPASHRHLIVAGTFGFLLLLPVAVSVAPSRVIKVPVLPKEVITANPVSPAPSVSIPSNPSPAASRSVSVREMVTITYLGGVFFFVVSLGVALLRLQRLKDEAEVSVPGTRLAGETAREAGINRNVEVLVSSIITVPITYGVFHPSILLPAATRQWSDEDLQRAISHELEHIRRSDWVTQLASRVVCALYWPHPLVWTAWRRLCLEAERACDDAVVRRAAAVTPYAEQLVELARTLKGRASVPALAMATRSNLGQRVASLLDPRRGRGPATARACLVAATLALLGLALFAPLRLVQAASSSSHIAQPDVVTDALGVALLEAAAHGKIDSITRLLAAGADVNAAIDGDGSPLIVAAKNGQLDAVRLLLDRGADVNQGVLGDGNALIMAAGSGHVDVVTLLLDRGAEIDLLVPGDENPLIEASAKGQEAVVRLLISRGANVNARVWADHSDGGEWRTPLNRARRNGHENIVKILRAAGAEE